MWYVALQAKEALQPSALWLSALSALGGCGFIFAGLGAGTFRVLGFRV